jgi:hypothetical protein
VPRISAVKAQQWRQQLLPQLVAPERSSAEMRASRERAEAFVNHLRGLNGGAFRRCCCGGCATRPLRNV